MASFKELQYHHSEDACSPASPHIPPPVLIVLIILCPLWAGTVWSCDHKQTLPLFTVHSIYQENQENRLQMRAHLENYKKKAFLLFLYQREFFKIIPCFPATESSIGLLPP